MEETYNEPFHCRNYSRAVIGSIPLEKVPTGTLLMFFWPVWEGLGREVGGQLLLLVDNSQDLKVFPLLDLSGEFFRGSPKNNLGKFLGDPLVPSIPQTLLISY